MIHEDNIVNRNWQLNMAHMARASEAVQMAGGAPEEEILEMDQTFYRQILTCCPPMPPMQCHISLRGLDEVGNPMSSGFEASSPIGI